MAKPPTEPQDVAQELQSLTAQVQALTEALVERDKQVHRLAETCGHLAARAYNVEFLVDLRKSAGQGLDALRFAPGLTADTYTMIVDNTRDAILGS